MIVLFAPSIAALVIIACKFIAYDLNTKLKPPMGHADDFVQVPLSRELEYMQQVENN